MLAAERRGAFIDEEAEEKVAKEEDKVLIAELQQSPLC